ncbi:helix-turn-helix transcriptional regulator [Clostridium sp. Marseille-Q2269]|uniref:helix-turn-helix domain-containing protein n=1 Tax=Clostridium sp. Marseille-Q2269 TaxID=2942205 RepID=UPI002073D08B|nr:helix-turn-helix transcriptional regulator [Clostridium sp. Marseille-Q2269]
MILVNLDVMMAKQKISLTDLSQELGITMGNISNFKNQRAKALRFTILDNLCRILQCQPGDILEYIQQNNLENGKGTVKNNDYEI